MGQTAYAHGAGGLKFLLNQDGELIVRDVFEQETFIHGFENGMGGINVGTLFIESFTLGEGPKMFPNHGVSSFFKTLFGEHLKNMTGESHFVGVDPLMLDLDGDGLELRAQTGFSPLFDLDDDGFAERVGWLNGDDGILVRDLNSSGTIDDPDEMFGTNGTSGGFADLASLDSNTSGTITSADTNWSSLRVWRDLDGDGVTDSGELKTLSLIAANDNDCVELAAVAA